MKEKLFSPHKLKYITTILAFLFVVTASAAHAEIVVIGNPGMSVESLDRVTVRKLFLGQILILSGGRTTVFDQQDDSEVKAEFYSKAASKSLFQLHSYWSRMIYSGQRTPPEVLSGDLAVLKKVAEMSNAIGYINAKVVDGSVKILFRLP